MRPAKKIQGKAKLASQLRELLSREASASASAGDDEESRVQRVLRGQLTMGKTADGITYWEDDDEDEPWADVCDGCRAEPVRGASWFKCARCPAVDLCARCALVGCRGCPAASGGMHALWRARTRRLRPASSGCHRGEARAAPVLGAGFLN